MNYIFVLEVDVLSWHRYKCLPSMTLTRLVKHILYTLLRLVNNYYFAVKIGVTFWRFLNVIHIGVKVWVALGKNRNILSIYKLFSLFQE